MPRIPLFSFFDAVTPVPGYYTGDMVIFNGPCYIMHVDGVPNIVYDINPYKVHGLPEEKLEKYLRKQSIPKVWR